MVVVIARLEIEIPGARSLKDKRQVLRRVLERLRSRFPVSAAEVEDQDLWQRAVIGVACVSGSGAHAEAIMQQVVDFVATAHPEAELLDWSQERVEPF